MVRARTHTFAFLAPYLMIIISVVVLAAIVVLVVVSFVILKRGEIYQKNWGVGSAGISID
jgi:hypothetical protein